jgi:DNA-binding PadR family transcriptional regulator
MSDRRDPGASREREATTPRLGEFEQLVLLAILRSGEEAYGVPIVEQIKERTGREASRSAVYVALTRLEKRGLVSSRMGDPTPERGGKARRYFRLEPAAIELVRESKASLESMWEGLDPILG